MREGERRCPAERSHNFAVGRESHAMVACARRGAALVVARRAAALGDEERSGGEWRV
jgi:hypothetical protein